MVETEFDPAYYLAAYPDVAASGVDPLDHYLHAGAGEGRNPNEAFDALGYLATNPDVAASGADPFHHYLTRGRAEGRIGRHEDAIRRQALVSARPMGEHARRSPEAQEADGPLDPASLRRALAPIAAGGRLALAVSHGDYRGITGGIERIVWDEEIRFVGEGWHYLHVAPARRLPALHPDDATGEGPDLFLTLNGASLGRARGTDVLGALRGAMDARGTRSVRDASGRDASGRDASEGDASEGDHIAVVHSLLGHAPEAIARLADAIDARTYVWAHDYLALCSNWLLLRNDIEHCGAPPPGSPACSICAYGVERVRHVERISALHEALRPVLLAPSAPALSLWRARADHPLRDARVAVPARIEWTGTRAPLDDASAGRPLRIAFVGHGAVHKGWGGFDRLVRRFRDDPRYEFLHLGDLGAPPLGMERVTVRVGSDDPDAMVRALREREVDVALVWSLWPETFSFTTVEAMAAGAFLLVRASAGNAVRLAEEHRHGLVLPDETALLEAFGTGSLIERVRAAREGGVAIGKTIVDVPTWGAVKADDTGEADEKGEVDRGAKHP